MLKGGQPCFYKMRSCCPIRLTSKAMLTLGLGFAVNVSATSKLYYGKAGVTMKDNTPCFYAKTEEPPRMYEFNVVRLFNYGNFKTPPLWSFEVTQPSATVPITRETCLEYGESHSNQRFPLRPPPLKLNTPYQAVFDSHPDYGVKFCILQKADGTIFLAKTGTGESKQCLPISVE